MSLLGRAPLVYVLVLLLPLACGCRPDDTAGGGSPPAESSGTAAESPLPAPDLLQRNDLVQAQLRERLRWLERMRAQAGLTASQQGEAWGEVAMLYHAYAFPEAAEAYYQRAAQAAPADPRWHYYLGQLHRSQNRLPESRASFEAARRLDPDDVPTLVRLGEVLLDLERVQEAAPPLERAELLDPRCAAAHFSLGQLARNAGDHGRAVEHFERVLALQPEATGVHHALGLAYREMGQETRAREQLQKAGSAQVKLSDPRMLVLRARSDVTLAAIERGRTALAEGRAAEARDAFREAVAADPLFSLPRVQYARALFSTGETALAREQLELALASAPESADAHFNLAFLLAGIQEGEAATRHYRRGLELEPDNVPGRLALGMLLLERGELPAADAELARVIELAPASRTAWIGRATVLIESGRCAEARAWLEQGLSSLERDGVLGHGLSRVLAGCPDPAVRDGERALTISSSLFEALSSPAHAEAVAMALAELGRFEEAVRWQERALEQARAGGAAELASLLEPNLERFRSGLSSSLPWPRHGLGLFALPSVLQSGSHPERSRQPS